MSRLGVDIFLYIRPFLPLPEYNRREADTITRGRKSEASNKKTIFFATFFQKGVDKPNSL